MEFQITNMAILLLNVCIAFLMMCNMARRWFGELDKLDFVEYVIIFVSALIFPLGYLLFAISLTDPLYSFSLKTFKFLVKPRKFKI